MFLAFFGVIIFEGISGTLTETSFAITSYSFEFFFWLVNCSNLVYKLFITFWKCEDIHCLCWKVFSTDICRKIFFNSCYFFSYICWSVNYMGWVSKFKNVLMTCTETEARFIFEGFQYFPLWKVRFQLSNTFFAFLSGL